MLFSQYILPQLALLSIQDVNVAQIRKQFDTPGLGSMSCWKMNLHHSFKSFAVS